MLKEKHFGSPTHMKMQSMSSAAIDKASLFTHKEANECFSKLTTEKPPTAFR